MHRLVSCIIVGFTHAQKCDHTPKEYAVRLSLRTRVYNAQGEESIERTIYLASHPSRKLKRKGESLVHFDHVLDVVGRGLQFAADFAYALTLTMADRPTEKL